MGITKCEIHGQTGTTLISSDIEDLFLTNQKPYEKYHQIKVRLFNRVVNLCWFSSSFVERYNIPIDKETLSLEDIPDEYEEELLSSLVPVCGKCFKDWVDKYSSALE